MYMGHWGGGHCMGHPHGCLCGLQFVDRWRVYLRERRMHIGVLCGMYEVVRGGRVCMLIKMVLSWSPTRMGLEVFPKHHALHPQSSSELLWHCPITGSHVWVEP